MTDSTLYNIYFLLITFLLMTCSPQRNLYKARKFDLGNGKLKNGYTRLTIEDKFTTAKGVGLVSVVPLEAVKNGITSSQPFYFVKQLPEGNYRVTISIGDINGVSNTTVKAENRRLMAYDVSTKQGEVKEISFLVHLRSPLIEGDRKVALKKREHQYLSWDDKLTLEFSGTRPVVASIEIEPVTDVPVVYLVGNSTVVDQAKEPYASWGQMFPLFFKDEVVIANHAESGETLKAFRAEGRLDKIGTLLKPSDYMFIEFAHNDQKPGNNHLVPYGTYQAELLRFAQFAKQKGAIPVFVSSTARRAFDASGKISNTLGDYPAAMRALAQEEQIAFIDLNAMSSTLLESLGPDKSKDAFLHIPANTYLDQPTAIVDNTHFSTYGAYELAKCVVKGLQATNLPLNKHLKNRLTYHPEQPMKLENWKWQISPLMQVQDFVVQ